MVQNCLDHIDLLSLAAAIVRQSPSKANSETKQKENLPRTVEL